MAEPAQAAAKSPEEIAKDEAAKKAKADAKKAAKEAQKAAKEAKKQERLRKRQEEEAERNKFVKDPNDPCTDQFGDLPLNMSQCDPETRFTKKYVAVQELDASKDGQEVRIRCRVHNSRGSGNSCFIVAREGYSTVQCLMFVSDGADGSIKISKGMCKYSSKIPKESIIEIVGVVSVPEAAITGCTQPVELKVKEIWTVNKSVPILPFQIEDASRQVLDQEAEMKKAPAAGEEEKKDGDAQAVVYQDVRLNNRIIDLRVPTNQAIFRLQSGVCQIYREFMLDNDFVEIHTPKLIGGASEGGANVFKFKYFEQDACLAQSPQLYKQMALCADFQRVFEIGPVFRAENSNTNRHLCEFTGLDMEMEFKNHYFEVLDLIADLMAFMFTELETRYARELDVINQQYPFEKFKCAVPVVKLDFKEGVKLLHEAGI